MASIEQSISTYQKAMNLRVQRHQALASNIANADTPNYKARDLDFNAAMHQAMGGQSSGGQLAMNLTTGGHRSGTSAGGDRFLQYRKETQSAVDGNTVDMDVERAQIADNALQYQMLVTLISEKFKGMRSAMASTNS